MAKEVENGFDAMIEACQIFKKYAQSPEGCDLSYAPFNCSHDMLTVCAGVDPGDVGFKDKARLKELGFDFDSTEECFYSFRFGSC